MNIVLFGGTFDPPHRTHQQMVATLLERGMFDQVWYVPVAVHDKDFIKKHMSSVEQRLAMLELVLRPQTKIDLYEIESGRESFTHRTLRELRDKHPEHTFSWIMGSDQLEKLHLWRCDLDKACFPQVLDEFDYYVYPRKGFPLDLPYKKLKVIEDVEPMPDSSTLIRQKMRSGGSISGLVIKEVEEYIKLNKLYLRS